MWGVVVMLLLELLRATRKRAQWAWVGVRLHLAGLGRVLSRRESERLAAVLQTA
jgi:hypothetical protein